MTSDLDFICDTDSSWTGSPWAIPVVSTGLETSTTVSFAFLLELPFENLPRWLPRVVRTQGAPVVVYNGVTGTQGKSFVYSVPIVQSTYVVRRGPRELVEVDGEAQELVGQFSQALPRFWDVVRSVAQKACELWGGRPEAGWHVALVQDDTADQDALLMEIPGTDDPEGDVGRLIRLIAWYGKQFPEQAASWPLTFIVEDTE